MGAAVLAAGAIRGLLAAPRAWLPIEVILGTTAWLLAEALSWRSSHRRGSASEKTGAGRWWGLGFVYVFVALWLVRLVFESDRLFEGTAFTIAYFASIAAIPGVFTLAAYASRWSGSASLPAAMLLLPFWARGSAVAPRDAGDRAFDMLFRGVGIGGSIVLAGLLVAAVIRDHLASRSPRGT